MGILNTIKNKMSDTDVVETKDAVKKVESTEKESKKVAVAKEETKKVTKKSDKKVFANGNAYKVLVRPLITEKVTDMSAYNKYAFEVSINTNKQEIKKAITEVYGVTPIAVHVINMIGKKVRSGRSVGKKKDWKKAVITLKAGEKIEVYQGV